MTGIVGAGDTIIGPGYSGYIDTSCKCMNISSPSMISNGILTLQDQQEAIKHINEISPYLLVANTSGAVANSDVSNGIITHMIIGNVRLCGGYSFEYAPVCTTNMSSFTNADVASTFQTDGTTASISLVNSEVYDVYSVQTASNAEFRDAWNNMLSPGVAHTLETTVPAMLPALLWWASPDLLALDPALIAGGIETLNSIILRAAVQRSFDTLGTSCPRYANQAGLAIISLEIWGQVILYVNGGVQLFFSLLALSLSCTWFFATSPIAPAIRLIHDPTYFMTLLADSPFTIFLNGTNNAPKHVIWQALDTVGRLGETLDTLNEQIGHIKIDRYSNLFTFSVT